MRLTAACLRQTSSAVNVKQGPTRLLVPEGSKRSTAGVPRKFTHVTSDKLCDDVLRFLGPTLPPPQTCDIIDLNPGQCLWSRKLHGLIQPRRHILVQPRRGMFAEFVEPLLAGPETKYRYAETIEAAMDPQNRLLSEEVYRSHNDLKDITAEKYATNRSLLITANLSGAGRAALGFTGSGAKQFLNDYYRSIFIREKFMHQYGLVRMLAWVADDARKPIMPMTVHDRTKQSVQLETTCTVDQVAGPSQFAVKHRMSSRWYYIDVENEKEVRSLQKKAQLNIPPYRNQPNPIEPFAAMTPTIEEVRKNKDLYPHNKFYISRLLDLDDHLATNDPEWYAEYQKELDVKFSRSLYGMGRRRSLPEQKAYRTFMIQLRTHHNTHLKVKDFIWEQRQLFLKFKRAQESGWFSPDTGLPIKGPHEKKAWQLIRDDDFMHEQRQKIKRDTEILINKAGDDSRCFDGEPRTLAWNLRSHNPLLVDKTEFHPNHPLTLFDIQPNPNSPLIKDTVDKQICFDYVCTLLMMNSGETVANGLKRLIPAGYEQFVERVPELKNVAKGGWWNLERIRTRALHHDLFVAIASAFHDWPHRPPIGKLMHVYKGVFDDGPI